MAYTKVKSEDVEEILTLAGLGGLKNIEDIAGGWANSNYLLTLIGGQKLILKIWNERGPIEVQQLVENTIWLANNGVKTPVPLNLKGQEKGDRVLVKNGMSWMLLPYIPDGWLGFDDASLFSLGKVQAELHATPPPNSLGRDFVVGFTLFNRLFKLADEQNIWSPFLHRLQTEAIMLNREIPKNLPTGIIHGDLFPDNVLGSEGVVTAILDFEECCIGELGLDLAMSLVGFGWKGGRPVGARWREIISGYESVRILTDEEWGALPTLHRYATLSVAAWRYWQFVINIPNTEHTDRYVEMVERIDVELPQFVLERRQ